MPVGTGSEIAAKVADVNTSAVSGNVADGLEEVAKENPDLASLAEVTPVLAPPAPPEIAIVVEYEVSVSAGGGGDAADQISAMDPTSFSEAVTENVKAADPKLSDIVVDKVRWQQISKR